MTPRAPRKWVDLALKINSLCSDFSQKFGPVRTVTAGQVRLQLILRDCSYEDNRQKCWEWCGMLGQGWIRWEISQMPGIQYWHAFAGWWFQFFCIFKQKSSVFGRIIPASSNVFFSISLRLERASWSWSRIGSIRTCHVQDATSIIDNIIELRTDGWPAQEWVTHEWNRMKPAEWHLYAFMMLL